ncbi:MAG: glycosyltransferase family 4 protein [Planctomycetes bacterium]|nr:glycosyltransferase family 4 protein [Planctomycetota bacterium]
MRPIRVLHFRREVPTGGGPETLILGVSRCIDRSRFDLRVAALDTHSPPDSPMSVGLRQTGTPMILLPARHRFDRSVIRGLVRVLDEHEIDVLHTHDHRTNLIAWLASRSRPTPLVATLHQPLRRHWWLKHFEILDEFIVRRFDRILPVAEMIRQELIARHPELTDRTRAVLNGVDLRRFDGTFDRARVRAELSVSPDQMLCMTVGRLSDDKGIPYLVESIRHVIQVRRDVRWAIAGRGPLEDSLRAKAHALGVDDFVSFLGFREDVPDLLAAADVLVVASTSEGCPVVVLEAMAAGCPAICTRVGGSPEIVADGTTGYVVEPRRPDQLAKAVLEMAAGPGARAEMGRRARQLVRERFSIERMVREFEEVYADLAGRSGS